MNFNGVGLIGDGGGEFLVTKRVSEERGKELIWSGEKVGAEEAVKVGVGEGVFEEEVDGYEKEWVKGFMKMGVEGFMERKGMYLEE